MFDGAPQATEEVDVWQLHAGDVLLLAAGEYPVREVEHLHFTVRVRFARMRPGVIDEAFGSLLFVAGYKVRRVRR